MIHKTVLLFIILFSIACLSQSFVCGYKGKIFQIKYNETRKYFEHVTMELDDFAISIDATNCIKQNDSLVVEANIYFPPVSQVIKNDTAFCRLILLKSDDEKIFYPIDTIGSYYINYPLEFSVKRKKNEYLFLQNDYFNSLVYEINSFKK